MLPGRPLEVEDALLTSSPDTEIAAFAEVLALVNSATLPGSRASARMSLDVIGAGEFGTLGVWPFPSSEKGGISIRGVKEGSVSPLTRQPSTSAD